MKIVSFKSVLLLTGLVAVLGVGIKLALKNQELEKSESIVVMAFVDNNFIPESNVIREWQNRGITIEFVDNCTLDDDNASVKCVIELIENIAKVTNTLNSRLVVLGQEKYAQNLLQAFAQSDLTEHVSALALLQANFKLSFDEEIKLPKTVVISASEDAATEVITRRRMVSKLLDNDNWVWSTTLITKEHGNLFAHPVIPEIILYMLEKPWNPQFIAEFNAESRWQTPLFDNNAFYAVKEVVQEYPVDPDLRRILAAFYHHESYQLKQWPLDTYQSFDLIKFRSQLPIEEQGRYATFTNRKGHRFYLDLDRYGRYQPEFVIGIDDEKNLYRMSMFYKTKRFYSWEPGGPDEDVLYVQSLGAFIHFRKPLPPQYELPYLQYSTITFESIAFTDIDPFAGVKNLTHAAFRVLTRNCIPCHSVDGIGGAAYHIDSKTGEPQPGFARPLRTYSKDIYENFFYNQTATAALIGVNPNYVDRQVADELLPWLTENM